MIFSQILVLYQLLLRMGEDGRRENARFCDIHNIYIQERGHTDLHDRQQIAAAGVVVHILIDTNIML